MSMKVCRGAFAVALSGVLCLGASVVAPAMAQQDVTVKELRGVDVVAVLNARADTMKGMQRAMKELAAMVEGEAPFDGDKAHKLAALIEHNTRAIPSLFPEGTQIRGSKALDEVWEEPEDFVKRAEAATLKAIALTEAAEPATEVDAIADAFKDVALSCRACHKDYKKPF